MLKKSRSLTFIATAVLALAATSASAKGLVGGGRGFSGTRVSAVKDVAGLRGGLSAARNRIAVGEPYPGHSRHFHRHRHFAYGFGFYAPAIYGYGYGDCLFEPRPVYRPGFGWFWRNVQICY